MSTMPVNKMTQACQAPSIFILMFLISLSSVTVVLPTPALAKIAEFFNIGTARAQLTVTVFLLGYVIGQLIYGPLTDRFGYKKALYIGLTLNLMGLLMSGTMYFYHNYDLFLLSRLVSALGTSATLACTFVIINSHFSKEKALKVISFNLFAFNVGAGLAVAVGGILTHYLGWRSCFVFLFVYGLFALLAVRFIPGAHFPHDKNALKPWVILKSYCKGFSSPKLVLLAIVTSISASVAYTYSAASPLVADKFMQMNPEQYGLWTLVNTAGVLIGAILVRISSHWMRSIFFIFLGLILSSIGVAALGYYIWAGLYHMPWLFFCLTAYIFFAVSFIYPHAASLATGAIKEKASAASSMNFLNMGTATVAVFVMPMLPRNISFEFVEILAVVVVVGFVCACLGGFLRDRH